MRKKRRKELSIADSYSWNTRLRSLKSELAKYKELSRTQPEYVASCPKYKEDLEWLVYDALKEFQPHFHFLIMKWANEAGIGPGFVIY